MTTTLSPPRAARLVLGAVLLCGTFAATGASAAPTPRADVDDLIEAMEFERVAGDLVESVRQQSDTDLRGQMHLGSLSPERARRLRELFGAAYTRERFVESMARSLSERLSPADTAALVVRYRTPFGRRQLEAERTHDLNTDRAGFERFVQTYAGRADHVERKALSEAITTAQGVPGSMASVVIDMQVAMLVSLGRSVHAMSSAELEPLIAQARARQPALEAQFDQLLPLVVAWSYQDMTLAELAAIRDESMLPLKARETKAIVEGLRAGFVNANLAFADALSAYLRVAETSGEI